MARLETPQGGRERADEERPPADDQHLDEWFARRLEAQGIPSRIPRASTTRVLAVAALLAALLGLAWAFSASGSSDSTTADSTQTTGKTTPSTSGNGDGNASGQNGGGTGNGKGTGAAVSWREIPIDVLNGFGGSGAASATQELLTSQGWQVRSTGNAGTGAASTVVVYTPGNKAKARIVARKLGLDAPVPISSEPDIPAGTVSEVGVLLGPDLLPTT